MVGDIDGKDWWVKERIMKHMGGSARAGMVIIYRGAKMNSIRFSSVILI